MAKNLQPFRKNKTDGTPQIYKAYFVNAVREILSSGERLFKKTRAISDVCRYLNLGQNKKDKVYFTFTDLKRLEEFALNNYGCEFISEAMNFSGKLFKAISENDKKAHIIRSDVDEDSNSLPF